MAKIEKIIPLIAKFEGGYVNDPKDKGGATNMGVTLATWKSVGYDKNFDGHIDEKDIKMLNHDDFKFVLKKYWNNWKADKIENQSIANILVDWHYMSGKWAMIIPQRILGVTADGVIGPKTIEALNATNQEHLFNEIKSERVKFYENIVKNNPSQKRFLNGWMNRLNQFKYLC